MSDNGIHMDVVVIDEAIDLIWASPQCGNLMSSVKNRKEYVITGKLKSGKRFKPIHTETPQHYNIWSGTIWQIMPTDGKRRLIKRIYN